MNVIGLDLGTTTLSAVALDGETGRVLETLNVPNAGALPPRQPWERIQDADRVAAQALELAAALTARHGASAIGLDGQMHGMLYVDGAGRAVSPLFTWQDQRGETPMDGETCARRLSGLTGQPMATGYGLTTHFWHVRHGRVPAGAAGLCTVCDYVGMKLTGRRAPLTHVSSAASLGLFDAAAGDWRRETLAAAGMGDAPLPPVTGACALLGETAAGVPVACGIGDNQASFIGAMRDMRGGVLVNMGTGGQISMLADVRAGDGDIEVRPLGEGQNLLVGSALCGGRSYALLEGFLRSCARLAGGGDEPLYEVMNRLGLEALEDPALLRVDTRFNGTRARPELRGAVTGIGTENFDAAHLIGGTLLGMAGELHGLYREMRALGAPPAAAMVGSGNAIRRNPALRRAFERVFDLPLRVPVHGEEAACGAALFAMAAAGLVPSLADAQRLIRYA